MSATRLADSARVPRALHPLAWWVWAIALAFAVHRTTNPLLLVLVLAVLGFVVARRRTDAPWARAFRYYLVLAGVVIVLRVLFRIVFGTGVGPEDDVLVRLPTVPLPDWWSGVTLGGPVSAQTLLDSTVDGLRLGTLLCCIGAANALANPRRALRLLPGALYELGVAVVVAITVAPQLVESVQRVVRARRLRAGHLGGLRSLRSIVVPVLEDAFERSLRLAAAMDSRGYGRAGAARGRRLPGALLVAGLVGLCVGVYGLLDDTGPLGFPGVAVGAALCCAGLAVGGRRVRRTRYRPDPWLLPEWLVAGSGVLSTVLLYAVASAHAADLDPSWQPLAFPTLPLVPALAILLGATPAVTAPPVERSAPTPRLVLA